MTKRKLFLSLLAFVFVLQGCASGNDLSAKLSRDVKKKEVAKQEVRQNTIIEKQEETSPAIEMLEATNIPNNPTGNPLMTGSFFIFDEVATQDLATGQKSFSFLAMQTVNTAGPMNVRLKAKFLNTDNNQSFETDEVVTTASSLGRPSLFSGTSYLTVNDLWTEGASIVVTGTASCEGSESGCPTLTFPEYVFNYSKTKSPTFSSLQLKSITKKPTIFVSGTSYVQEPFPICWVSASLTYTISTPIPHDQTIKGGTWKQPCPANTSHAFKIPLNFDGKPPIPDGSIVKIETIMGSSMMTYPATKTSKTFIWNNGTISSGNGNNISNQNTVDPRVPIYGINPNPVSE